MQDLYLRSILPLFRAKPKLCRYLLSMNLVFAFIIASCLSVFAENVSAQSSITLNVKNASLEQVFKAIQKQSNYGFIYTTSQLESTKPVNINVKNETVENVLDIALKDQPITYTMSKTVIIIKYKNAVPHPASSGLQSVKETDIEVRGKVLNEGGQPVEGVTVTVKNTAISATTDAGGVFTLSTIDRDATLVFSHVGMETFELKVSGQKDLVVTLKTKVSVLGGVEVISTGFQEIPKERATGSFVHIDNKTLNQQTGANILQRLNGVTSGILFNIGKQGTNTSPAKKTDISIRGISTIEGPTDPLIVLDNFIYDGDLNNINPNDIESVTILKDGAATSIYGAQGGNGVIVLTTKKGKFNQRLRVSFNSNLIIDDKRDLYSLPQMSVSDYIDVEEYLFNRGFFDDVINSSFIPQALTPAVEVFLSRRDGLIDANDSANQINSLKQWDTRRDYDKYFNKRNILQQYSINLSGGSDKVSWLVSGAYDKTRTNSNTENERINFRFNNIIKPIKNLRIGLGVYYTNNRLGGNRMPGLNSVRVQGRQVPYLKFGESNSPLPIASVYRQKFLDTLGQGALLDWNFYPLEDYKHNSFTADRNDITSNINLNYQVLKGLEIDFSYQYQRQLSSTKDISDINSYKTRNLINMFTELTRDEVTGEVINATHNNLPVGDILGTSGQLERSQNFRAQINYNKTWFDHSISGIVGFQTRETMTDGGVSSTFYGYSDDPVSFGIVDFKNSYPTVFGFPQSVSGQPIVNGIQTYRFVSYFGNMAYTFKDRYTVSLSGRRDGSNIFGALTNDKWKPLWSTGVAWDISRESFYKFVYIPNLKLRATLGYSGNVDLRKTPYPIATYGTTDPNTGFPVASTGLLNDPLLRWEQTSQLNIGVDFSTRNQWLSGTLEYYRKKSKDLYGLAPSDYTGGGTSSRTRNVANMMGQGVDVLLRSRNLTGSLQWTTTFLFNYNMSKVTAYFSQESEQISSLISTIAGNGVIPIVGKPVYALAAYKWGGLNSEGNPQGYVDGQLSTDYDAIFNESTIKAATDNLTYIGPGSPPIFGNLINELSWKGLAFSFNISYYMGYYFRKPTIVYSSLFNNGEGHSDFEKRWKAPGDELTTNVPSMVYMDDPYFYSRDQFYNFSEINVLKGDHMRLQYVNLMYNFPGKILKMPVEQLQLYVNMANVGILWRANKAGIDPDYPYDFAPSKTYTIGLRASF